MIQPASTILYGVDNQTRSFSIFAGISFFSHLVLFVLVAFVNLPGNTDIRIQTPPSIDIDLLSFNPEIPLPPDKVEAPPVTKPLEPPIERPIDPIDQLINKIEKMPERVPQEKIPVKQALKKNINPSTYVKKPAKKNITKKPLVKKKIDTAKVIEDAVKRIEKQSEPHSKSVADRIESLKKEVQKQPSNGKIKSGSGSANNKFIKDFTQIEIFQAEVSVRLKNNWVFSEKLAGETKGLESRLVVKILPNGTITDVWFEKRSGNTYLDNSAYKTVMKSNPLPPLPEGYAYYHLVLGFTPSGLHQ